MPSGWPVLLNMVEGEGKGGGEGVRCAQWGRVVEKAEGGMWQWQHAAQLLNQAYTCDSTGLESKCGSRLHVEA